MLLKNLKLKFYRNLLKLDMSWNEHFNIIYGSNAQGKTNLLEAIYLLGHLKSFRGTRGHEFINHDAETAWIGATIEKKGVQYDLEIGFQNAARFLKINKKTARKLSDFLGCLRTVIFTPEELGCIKGFPAARRALLDRAILQTDPTYLDRVQEYYKILRHRNQLLKNDVDNLQLSPWTDSLARIGSRIRYDRLTYLSRIYPYLSLAYREITSGTETAQLVYSIEKDTRNNLEKNFLEELQKNSTREKKIGLTLAGPHRDDLDFIVKEKSLRSYGSQGQQRSYLLAFKTAQVMDIEKEFQEPPILLLDDLASELDVQRQEGFLNFLLNCSGQVFLTSAQASGLPNSMRQKASYFQVKNGTVTTALPKRAKL